MTLPVELELPTTPSHPEPPSRFRFRQIGGKWLAVGAVFLGLTVHGLVSGAVVTPDQLVRGLERLWGFLDQAFPPDFSNWRSILNSLLVTFEMAIIGTIAGVVLSLPLAVLIARNTSPSRLLGGGIRAFVALFRTVPDIIWGLIFVVCVGLGPPAGVLALTVDTIGFCARFFADSIEEVDEGVMDGLRATGASRTGIVAGAVLPSCLPSFVGTSMYALEKATRSSIVLGVVGAGGIGVELTTAMTLLNYDEAFAIILLILVVVLAVERLSTGLRRRIL